MVGKKAVKAQKSKKDVGEQDEKVQVEKAKPIGCICPTQQGCLVGTPIDPQNPGDAFKMNCTNGTKCTQVLYLHPPCLEALEAMMVRQFTAFAGKNGRGSTWTKQERVANIWNKKGYEILYKVCPCPCNGFIRKDTDYRPPGADDDGAAAAQDAEKKKKKEKKKKENNQKPTLTIKYPSKPVTKTFFDADDPVKRLALLERYDRGPQQETKTSSKEDSNDSYIPGLSKSPPRQESRSSSPPRSPKKQGADVHVTESALEYPPRDPGDNGWSTETRKEDEITTVEELLRIIDSVLEDGTHPKFQYEHAVCAVLSLATVDILSMIEEQGGFLQWIVSTLSENGPQAPFNLKVVDENIVKTPCVQEEKIDAHKPSEGGDTGDVEVEVEKPDPPKPTCDPPKPAKRPAPPRPPPPKYGYRFSPVKVVETTPTMPVACAPPNDDLKMDRYAQRRIEAHAAVSNAFHCDTVYSDALDSVRMMARDAGTKLFW